MPRVAGQVRAWALWCGVVVLTTGTGSAGQSAQGTVGAESAFEVATVRHPDPAARYHKGGFYGEPGGRVFLGVNVKMLVELAFNLRDFQVTGGPEWANAGWAISDWYDINAVPPDSSSSRRITVSNAEPTGEQRAMLRMLLRERFGFRYHMETRQREVYF
jgi:uncharacterized protein (TIGR03435 family)